jgi:3-oxoacyl-[acyl-carrier-protein] synthase-3
MIGIVGLAVEIPTGRLSVEEMQRRSGLAISQILDVTHCHQIPVLEPDRTIGDLMVSAAERAISDSGVAVSAIDHVVVAGCGQWEAPLWSPASHLAKRLGITEAHCFEMINFCNSAMTAVQVAHDMVTVGRARNVLVAVGDNFNSITDHADPDSAVLFNFGDAATAVVVGQDPRFVVKHTSIRTDPDWSDYFKGQYRDGPPRMKRASYRPGLAEAYVRNLTRLTHATLDAIDQTVSDVSYVLVNHGSKRVHERFLDALGVPLSRTVLNYDHLGHMGATDTLIALAQLHKQQALHAGDLILMATSGAGFTWGVTALEYLQ